MESDRGNKKRGFATGKHRHAMPAVADTTLSGKVISDLGSQNRDRRMGYTALIRENHRYTQVQGDLGRYRT